MENVVLCHVCVTQWIYRSVKAECIIHMHVHFRDRFLSPIFTVLSCIGLAGRPRHILLSFHGCSAGGSFNPKNPVRDFQLEAHAADK